MSDVDVAVIGAGPAGLSAALNLVRARRRTLLIDSNRPRNAATLASHGFLTRDGVPPLELRRLGREEFEQYSEATFHAASVDAIVPDGEAFALTGRGVRGAPALAVRARVVVVASGLSETLPAIPGLRAWYGTQLHSCVECDGYEKADAGLVLIGETDDLAERALTVSQWSRDLIVFTNGVGTVTDDEEAMLLALGVTVERRPIAEIEGESGSMTAVRLEDGTVIPRAGGFVRPLWRPSLTALDALDVQRDAEGLIVVDTGGRTSLGGLYAAGDATPPGPQQLIVAAGEGALVAAAVNVDLLRSDAGRG
ncbi:NAD(P)/FAD-dependent oxidoreductase [Agromyces atrinae]|uniref:NAD(P)/FAD-dependent oxidoreductase n=1 Tax=Agromyces atrinae TaxID=592376 RepID=A0A4Q2M2V1_9MICO|nr:NAD(P)/FAD-dependent oxidoreductase [Agromyces atrinae]NYD65689.1 thioredoxin reductase [Agromyces atrinae]RXZ85487.1 NAD(P)/FAD-dependent oxidoreductase [Agromyces atrinae]